MCPDIVTDKVPCLSNTVKKEVYVSVPMLFIVLVFLCPTKQKSTAVHLFEREACGIVSVESSFLNVVLYIKKLPITFTASTSVCGCEVLEITCNNFCRSCFQKGEKHVEKMAS